MMSDAAQPESTSVASNIAHNLPGTITDIGSNLIAAGIEPESLLLNGLMRGAKAAAPYTESFVQKPVNAVGRWIGTQAERFSGLAHKQPGVLAAAVEDPGLMFGPGRSSSQKSYDAAKNAGNTLRNEFKTIETKPELVSQTLEALDNRGITTQEALAARKALDKTKNHWSEEFYSYAREKLDRVAKQDFMGADAEHTRALQSEALRNPGSINKDATPAVVRNTLSMLQPQFAPLFSPAVQGLTASGIGVGKKAAEAALRNPDIAGIGGVGIATLLDKYRGKKEQPNGRKR